MKCAICGIRKPRRYCPGVHGDICTICCATEREQTVDCPLDCAYLRDAHDHERPPEIERSSIPNLDYKVSEGFIARNQIILMTVAEAISRVAAAQAAITDHDAREALAALAQTWRTLESGLYYETRPANPYAATICDAVKTEIEAVREHMRREMAPPVRDSDILGVLIFLQQLEYVRNNGRRKSKAFLDSMYRSAPIRAREQPEGLVAEGPRIVL